jgi:SpoVK/Ycf46/Vps4 family AAA+-type ATPase
MLAAMPGEEVPRHLAEGALSPRLEQLTCLFHLEAFEQDAFLVCLAPDIDVRYERLYSYLQDDVSRRRPTVDLILRLLTSSPEEHARERTALGPAGRLLSRGLLTVHGGEDGASQISLLSRPLRADERVVEYMLGSDRLDPRVAAHAQLFPAAPRDRKWLLPPEIENGLVGVLRDAVEGAPSVGPIVYLHGPPGSGKRATARAACAALGLPMLAVDLPSLVTEQAVQGTLQAVAREARLQQAVLALDGFASVLGDDREASTARALLRRILAEQEGPTLLLGDQRWEPSLWLPGLPAVRVELPPLAVDDRARLWRSVLDGQLGSTEVDGLATRYRIVDDDTIQAVAADATGRALLRGSATASPEDFWSAARAISTPHLEGLAKHVEPRYGWDDIVLPGDGVAQLRELCGRLRFQETVIERWGYGRKHARRGGISALFAGQPGTGKTMAAEIVAGELGLDLYRIDLSATVSKYIGETEKNLEKIFRAADQGDAVLLFDEADALFGKRSEVRDAHDRYANVEVAYLLQRLEGYAGLAVLTTNLRANIDEAFIRRLDCVMEFPLPEEAERLRIWRLALPAEAPLDSTVDLEFLASNFKLSGGHIRNIALTAGFLAAQDSAPIGMRHLVRATRREYQKLGKLIAESDFERYYDLLDINGGRVGS